METEVLLHARAQDEAVRSRLATQLRAHLRDAEEFIGSPREATILRETIDRTQAYFSAGNDSSDEALGNAVASFGELLRINIEQAKDSQDYAARVDRIADVSGVAAGGIFLLFAGTFLWWVNTCAFRPLIALASTMRRFGEGDARARAPEVGPIELSFMAGQFNRPSPVMASAVSRARANELEKTAADYGSTEARACKRATSVRPRSVRARLVQQLIRGSAEPPFASV